MPLITMADSAEKISEPDWDAIWDRNNKKSLAIFKVYSALRFKSYKELFSGLGLEGKSVLEIGGGSGLLGHMLSREFKCKLISIDRSTSAFRFHSRFGIPSENYIIGDVFDHDGRYFLVFSDGLIEHFLHDKRMDMIRRHAFHCSDDGFVAFFAPKKSFFVDVFLSLRGFLEKKYTLGELTSELIENGLEVIRTVEDFHMVGVLCKVKKRY